MKIIKEKFEEIKKSNDSEEINDFLIELGKNPKKEYLNFFNFLIENSEPKIIEEIKINLIWLLGEIGNFERLNDIYIDYFVKEYYKSDRWVRNEIIKAFGKVSNNTKLPDNVIKLVGYALNEDYIAIKLSALKTLNNLETLPNIIIKNIFHVLNSSDPKIKEYFTNILKKNIRNEQELFDLLNNLDIYKNLDKKAVRTLLLLYFNSIKILESFREIITNSKWENRYKELFFNEIDVYQKILIKKL